MKLDWLKERQELQIWIPGLEFPDFLIPASVKDILSEGQKQPYNNLKKQIEVPLLSLVTLDPSSKKVLGVEIFFF